MADKIKRKFHAWSKQERDVKLLKKKPKKSCKPTSWLGS